MEEPRRQYLTELTLEEAKELVNFLSHQPIDTNSTTTKGYNGAVIYGLLEKCYKLIEDSEANGA